MAKKKLNPKPWMFPKPAVLVGAKVSGKPNFMTIANAGIAHYDPPMVSISADKDHYTNQGIRKNRAFSVNFPSAEMARVADYVGLYSGNQVDKSKLFKIFYGELKTAPMIRECPVSLECRLEMTIDFGDDELFIGRIMAIYIDENCMTGERVDIKKINPLIYSTADKKYYRLGEAVGKAYNIGRKKGRP